VTEGNFISGVAGNSTLLTTIVTVDPIYVYADFDENSLLKFKSLLDQKKLPQENGKVPVQLQLGDESGFSRQGHIESLDNRLDVNTGSILLRAIFPNDDGRIVPGLFARIRVPLSGRYTALMIEERSIGTDQGQKFVLALSSTNTVQYRPVSLGPVVDGKRVVRSGLSEGEEIVINGLARVRPGMPVTPERQVAEKPKALKTALN
jgi:RND family efflux transporter MFP subunit